MFAYIMVSGTKKFTKTQLEIIRILLDERGHSLSNISKILNKEESNLKRSLEDLKDRLVIHMGEPRIPEGAKTTHKEWPYYLWLLAILCG